jgi:hypothetical protein
MNAVNRRKLIISLQFALEYVIMHITAPSHLEAKIVSAIKAVTAALYETGKK